MSGALFGALPWLPFEPGKQLDPATDDQVLEYLGRYEKADLAPAHDTAGVRNPFANQFTVFQFNADPDGAPLLDIHDIRPAIEGSDVEPDVRVKVELKSFHIAGSEDAETLKRATVRMDFVQRDSVDRYGELLSWSAASALELLKDGKRTTPDRLQTDISRSFQRPIEMPSGLGEMRFEVVAHREPPWWRRIFKFAETSTGQALAASVGFPGIALHAVGLLDEFFNRLDDAGGKSLFSSQPLTLAFSKRAHEEYTGGHPSIRVGGINRGHYLLCRQGDIGRIVAQNPVFYGGFGIIAPHGTPLGEVRNPAYRNPFEDVTYAILKIGVAPANVNPKI